MPLTLDFFTPPAAAHQVVELRLPAGASGPLVMQSHGFAYTVTGNTLLPAQTVERLIAQAQTPEDAVSALNAAYQKAGYLLVALRAQIQGKKVLLAVVQGQISSLHAQPDVARFYNGAQFDASLTQNALIRRNILAEAYASRSGLGFRPSIRPAPQPGGSALTVDTPRQPGFKPVSGNVVLGNYGSRYVGGAVLGENLTVRPGRGLEFNFGYAHGLPNLLKDSAGSRYDAANAGASVVTPWGFYGLNYSRSRYRLGVAGAPYYPQGLTETYSITGSQLAWASPTTRLSFNQALTHVAYKSTVLQGAYTLADQNYNYLTVGVQGSHNVQWGGLPGAVNLGLAYNQGLTGPQGTLVYDLSSAPQSRFHSWTLNTNWQQSLPQSWSLNLAASGQWGLDTLPANQQWVLGGYGNLSAWTPGILSGDGGYLLRAVAQTPNWSWGQWQVNAQAFAEQGAVTTHYASPGTPSWRMLADVGLGLTFTAPWKTTLSLTAARPVANKNVTASTLGSQRAVYLVLQQPF